MSLDIDRLMNNVRVNLPGVVDTNIQQEIFNVLNDFFQVTNAWQQQIPFGVTTGTTSYTITPTGTATINRLLGVVNSSNIPVRAIMSTPGTILLQDSPTQNDTFTATVAVTVVDPVDTGGLPAFPDWVLVKYSLGIMDGVIGRLMSQPAKPYSNPQLALVHTKSYTSVRSVAKAEVLHGNLNNGQTWSFPQNFRTYGGQRF